MLNQHIFRKMPFIIWMLVITWFSVIPQSDHGIMDSTNVTTSGMEKHVAGYLLAALLCYYAFVKKDGLLLYPLRSVSHGAVQQGSEGEGFRKDIKFIIISGLLIFLYSLVLEAIQIYLPYRTFNVYDIVANGCGVLVSMCIVVVSYLKNEKHKLL